MSDEKIRTFGYRNGESKIFHLGSGESLPMGWTDSPVKTAPKERETLKLKRD